jgi:D-alanyl-D-alanine carboxypeptidase
VVFGGRTASARDARVVNLIDNNINIAVAKRTAPPVVEGWDTADAAAKPGKEKDVKFEARNEPKSEPKSDVKYDAKASEPAAEAAVAQASAPEPALGSTDPIKPNAVKTFTVHPGTFRTASLSPLPSDSRKLAPATATATNVTNVDTVKSNTPALLPPSGAKPGVLGALHAKPSQVASAGDNVPVAAATPAAKPRVGGWMIQVGAFPDEKEAQQRLNAAQSKAKDQLGQADPFTEKVAKGDKALYRARFAGLEKEQAETACKHLKRSEIPCMLLKN